MKTNNFKIIAMSFVATIMLVSCSNSDNNSSSPDFSGTFVQKDQMARPAINTVFNSSADKDAFNITVPSAMQAAFKTKFEARLLALNNATGAAYTTNALNLDSSTFAGVLAQDVLTVSRTGATAFGSLKGRSLNDDVIDTELTLIFGGPTGGDKPAFTSDNVDANDKTFSTTFPYLATAW